MYNTNREEGRITLP